MLNDAYPAVSKSLYGKVASQKCSYTDLVISCSHPDSKYEFAQHCRSGILVLHWAYRLCTYIRREV